MTRTQFAALLGAGAVAAAGARRSALAAGGVTTQGELFAALPRPRVHQWTRIILGSGAKYQKQIGAGLEIDAGGNRLLYYEMQTGSPGGSCNPSTMRKAYLRAGRFGSLFDTYPLLANLGRTENMVYRYGDVAGDAPREPGDSTLRLLDEAFLYDARPLTIERVEPQRIHVSSRDLTATYVAARFAEPSSPHERLRSIELWHSPLFPFGVARYRAVVAGLDPFDLHVFSHGDDFVSLLNMSLAQVRAITKDGAYGQLPAGVGG